MSRLVLLFVSVFILKNEAECGALGKISKSDGSLLPRTERELPSHWTRLNSEFPARNKVWVNTIDRVKRAVNTTSKRQPKFLPKFSILAGLDIGGGLSPRTAENITPIARITQANSLPGVINPYFAASYDPYPSNAIQQSIQALYQLVERLTLDVDGLKKKPNSSSESPETVFVSAEDFNASTISDKRTRKDKFKIKKSSSKRKKQEVETEEEYDDEEKKQASQKVEKFQKIKSSSRKGVRKNTNAKQAVPANTTTTDGDANIDTGAGIEANVTEINSTTTTQRPGYYYGGNPQNLGGVGFTYEQPNQSYGSPSDNYGPPSANYPPTNSYGYPSYSYGIPSQSYGSPSYSYGPPSHGYGLPSYSHETAHYTSFHDNEPAVYDDPNDDSFGPMPSTRWRQRLPFARSQKITPTTRAPILPNSNGFIPI